MRPNPLRLSVMISGSVVAVLAATLLIFSTGLPSRADFTGYRVPGLSRPVAPESGAYAPPLQLNTLDGSTLSLEMLRGHPVVLNFWATWCAPCRQEMPTLQRYYADHADRGLRIVAVNMGEAPAQAAAWVRDFGLTFDILLDPDETSTQPYYLFGYPTTFIIDPEGVVLRVYRGPISADELDDALGRFWR